MTVPAPRVQPYYCPYCGDEDFVPTDSAPMEGVPAPAGPAGTSFRPPVPTGPAGTSSPGGAFHCRSCDRRFAVRFLGIGEPVVAGERRVGG